MAKHNRPIYSGNSLFDHRPILNYWLRGENEVKWRMVDETEYLAAEKKYTSTPETATEPQMQSFSGPMFGMRKEGRYAKPPLNLDKGHFQGSCNVEACQKPGATMCHMDNHRGLLFYCDDCARKINESALQFDGFDIIRPSKGEYPFMPHYYMIMTDEMKKRGLRPFQMAQVYKAIEKEYADASVERN